MKPHMERTDCLIRCHGKHCSYSQCCARENFLEEDTCKSEKDAHVISRRYEKKEIIPATSTINLEKFTIYKEEIPEQIASEVKLEISTRDLPCENTCRSSDEQKDQSIQDIGIDSSCKINDNATDRTCIVVDTNLGCNVIS